MSTHCQLTGSVLGNIEVLRIEGRNPELLWRVRCKKCGSEWRERHALLVICFERGQPATCRNQACRTGRLDASAQDQQQYRDSKQREREEEERRFESAMRQKYGPQPTPAPAPAFRATESPEKVYAAFIHSCLRNHVFIGDSPNLPSLEDWVSLNPEVRNTMLDSVAQIEIERGGKR